MSQGAPLHLEIHAESFRTGYEGHSVLSCNDLHLSGSIVALIGHNGAGKSTFMKSLLGLLPPYSGTFYASNAQSQRKLIPEQDMAFCPETGAVFADISVENYISLWSRLKCGNPKHYLQDGARYIDELEIAPLLKKLGRELSKGERRRVQTAVGFLTSPKFFLFDEPFDGLDVRKTHELSTLLQANQEEMSFLVSSHRMDVIERIADVAIVLKEGEVVCVGTIDTVCKDLSGNTFEITGVAEPERLYALLSTAHPQHLIEHIGNRIRLTGKNVEEEKIRESCHLIEESGVTIQRTDVSLVDAMNYHLQSSS
ncbi:MAG: ABC transporter ATP-binding protein [Bdellovibrionales bacterium]|nr:ABC transporter ATP-binding protein [Bdellovibrionales bacterium]